MGIVRDIGFSARTFTPMTPTPVRLFVPRCAAVRLSLTILPVVCTANVAPNGKHYPFL
jgi:hypothetical protein